MKHELRLRSVLEGLESRNRVPTLLYIAKLPRMPKGTREATILSLRGQETQLAILGMTRQRLNTHDSATNTYVWTSIHMADTRQT